MLRLFIKIRVWYIFDVGPEKINTHCDPIIKKCAYHDPS